MSRFDMDRLTAEDVEMLLDSLTKLEQSDASEYLTTSLIGIMTAPSKEAAKASLAEMRRDAEQAAPKKRILQERVALLKAKIILLRDRQFAEDVLSADVPSREK